MSSERIALRTINCRLKECVSGREDPEAHPRVCDITCDMGLKAEPVAIDGFAEPYTMTFECFEECRNRISGSERFSGVGTFAEWPENSHFFGG